MTRFNPPNTRESLLHIAYADSVAPREEDSREIYDYLQGEMSASVHGERFQLREFSLEPIDEQRPSGLDIDNPYVVTNEVEPQEQKWLAETIGRLLLPEKDFVALVQGMKEVYFGDTVQEQLLLGNSVAFISNHLTYADVIAEEAALTIARLDEGEANPNYTQDVIAHRITGLFKHDFVKMLYEGEGYEGHEGNILEDVILQLGGDLHTLPSSNSGFEKLLDKVPFGAAKRKSSNGKTNQVFDKLINLGNREFFIAGSGQQSSLDGGTGIMSEATLGKGTVGLFTKNNQTDGAERLLAAPIYMHADPFSVPAEGLPVNPQPTPFAFLEPRHLKTQADAHQMMADIVAVGNQIKPSGAARIAYDWPGPDMIHKRRSSPDLTYEHRAS
jgi:hypothetical protein